MGQKGLKISFFAQKYLFFSGFSLGPSYWMSRVYKWKWSGYVCMGKIRVCGFCPFALMPLPLPLFLSWFSCSFKFWRLSREVIFCICFHISVFVQISSTLLMLLLPAQMTAMTFFSWRQTTSLPFLAANVEALSKHLKAWRWARRRCRSSRDLRIWIANAKYCLFWFDI